jgi:hypothetical protein
MSEPTARACSEASLASGEPLVGTASDARFFAAVSWPKALWHHDKVALSEGLPESLRTLESSARQSGQKLQLRLFQRAGGAAQDRVEVICVDFQRARTAQLRELPAERSAASIAAFLAGEDVAMPLESPLLLVCTDGKHDLCCGKLGRTLVSSLRSDARVDVAEVSHLGGHRLAANCLALPSGRLYGRVTAADLPGLVDAIRHDHAYLARYRGRSGLSELMQIAEAATLGRVAPGFRLDVALPEPAGDSARLCVAGLELDFVRRRFSGIASCGDTEPELRERWVLQSVIEKER